jgi:hypothetical protein
MNRYRRGLTFGPPPGMTQLKVENPVSLRTICNFAFREHIIVEGQAETWIKFELKTKNRRSSLGGDTNIARRKSARHGGKGFIDENGGGPGVRLRKRQQKRKM